MKIVKEDQDLITYELYDGQELVFVGFSNDPGKAIREQRGKGRRFTKLRIIGTQTSPLKARDSVSSRLKEIKVQHGDTPKYNKLTPV